MITTLQYYTKGFKRMSSDIQNLSPIFANEDRTNTTCDLKCNNLIKKKKSEKKKLNSIITTGLVHSLKQ